MSTPTPRTDAAWTATFRENPFSAGKASRSLREFSQKLEREFATERQKVRALTAILESICEEWGRNHDTNPIGAGQRMETLASKALEKLEDEA